MSKKNFRYLILVYLLTYLLMILKIGFLPANFDNENLQHYYEFESFISYPMQILLLVVLPLDFIFAIMMYFFISYSRQLWIIVCLISFIDIDFGPTILDYSEFILFSICIGVQGIMIYSMFFTSIKNEFKK